MNTLKQCTKCKKEKPIEAFYKCKRYKDGYRSWCKTCDRHDDPAAWKRQKAKPGYTEYHRIKALESYHRRKKLKGKSP